VTAIASQRAEIGGLINPNSPADAFTAYYALYHDPKRTAIFLHHNQHQHIDGFLARAQTGLDLFRPVVVMRAQSPEAASDLFRSGLSPNRPYYLVAPIALQPYITSTLTVSDTEILRVFMLDTTKFEPQINVMVVANPTADGLPRYEVSQHGTVYAAAGLNWQSPRFAEIYVYTEPAARGRGWGKAVVMALANDLLQRGLRPLYVVNEHNTASISLATSAGFVDTNAREFSGQVVLAV
jgi:ribosomal protein S18 acetylase RimI-like enzyme